MSLTAPESDALGFLTSTIAVHRVAYILTRGFIPQGGEIRQSCGNKVCCRPAHFVMEAKRGRPRSVDVLTPHEAASSQKGKLSIEQAREIRTRANQGDDYESMAVEYDVTTSTISCIARGITWKQITDIPIAPKRDRKKAKEVAGVGFEPTASGL